MDANESSKSSPESNNTIPPPAPSSLSPPLSSLSESPRNIIPNPLSQGTASPRGTIVAKGGLETREDSWKYANKQTANTSRHFGDSGRLGDRGQKSSDGGIPTEVVELHPLYEYICILVQALSVSTTVLTYLEQQNDYFLTGALLGVGSIHYIDLLLYPFNGICYVFISTVSMVDKKFSARFGISALLILSYSVLHTIFVWTHSGCETFDKLYSTCCINQEGDDVCNSETNDCPLANEATFQYRDATLCFLQAEFHEPRFHLVMIIGFFLVLHLKTITLRSNISARPLKEREQTILVKIPSLFVQVLAAMMFILSQAVASIGNNLKEIEQAYSVVLTNGITLLYCAAVFMIYVYFVDPKEQEKSILHIMRMDVTYSEFTQIYLFVSSSLVTLFLFASSREIGNQSFKDHVHSWAFMGGRFRASLMVVAAFGLCLCALVDTLDFTYKYMPRWLVIFYGKIMSFNRFKRPGECSQYWLMTLRVIVWSCLFSTCFYIKQAFSDTSNKNRARWHDTAGELCDK